MSRSATYGYGESFINGVLAGQKFKQFNSDLKASEIQRQLLEQTLQHNATMQPLAMSFEQAKLESERTRGQGLALANQFAERTFAERLTEIQANAETAKSNATTAGSNARVATATEGSRIGTASADLEKAKSDALAAKLRALDGVGSNVGAGDMTFNDVEIGGLLTALNIPESEKATRDVFGKMVQGSIAQGQQRYRENEAKIFQVKQQQETAAMAQKGLLLEKMVRGGSVLSDLASQNPEGYKAARGKLAEFYGEDVATVADLAVESARRRSQGPQRLTPEAQQVSKSIGDKRSELATLEANLNRLLRAKKPDTSTPWSLDSTDLERERAAARELVESKKEEIKQLRAEDEGLSPPADQRGSPDDIALVYKKSGIDLSKSKLTDDQIQAEIKALESRGVRVDVMTFKKYLESLRSK